MLGRLVTYGVFTCMLLSFVLWQQRQCSGAPLEQKLPIATITLTVREEGQDDLIVRLKEFAEVAAFATRVVHPLSDKRRYLVEFWRMDVNITVVNPFNVRDFSVFIYPTGQTAVPMPHLDAVISHIQDAINDVPGATIKNIKKSNE